MAARIEHDDMGEPIVRTINENRLRHILARVARWIKVRTVGGEAHVVDAMPPVNVVRDLLATPDMRLPVLSRLVEAPVFAPDGTLQTKPGYHSASRTYYVPATGLNIPKVPEHPDSADIEAARNILIDDLLPDFPFVGEAERAHAIAFLLLPFARDLIEGATPLHLIEKPSPGTGATLLVDCLGYPATGRSIACMTEGRDEDEWRKRITAKLRSAKTVILIDNLRRRLDSAAVSSAITSPTWEDRLLGASEIVRIPVRCAWCATGNNPAVSSEISRRTIRIRLDAKVDRPWLRDGFRHPDLIGWVRSNRALLVWAALVLIRAWVVAGRPAGKQKLGMFEAWSQTIGGILRIAGIPGFLDNLADFYDESDAESSQWRGFVAAWWDKHRDAQVKVADLWNLATADASLELGDSGEQSQKIRLGKLLSTMRDRTFELEIGDEKKRLTVVRGNQAKRAFAWQLREEI
jgi:hypothetical protein